MSFQGLFSWFGTVGQQWASSLLIFSPEKGKQFVLASLNAFVKAAKNFFKKFGWVLLIVPFVWMTQAVFGEYADFFLSPYFIGAIDYILVCFVFLVVRPSLSLKNCKYFSRYISSFFMLLLILFSIAIVQWFTTVILYMIFQSKFVVLLIERFLFLFEDISLFVFLPSPLFLYIGFFYFDSAGGLVGALNAIIRGVRMAFYTYPLSLILMFFFILIGFLVAYPLFILFSYLSIPFGLQYLINKVLFFVYYILVASCFSIIYTKKAHEDYDLFVRIK
ncbi:MAG: hypothetical protein WDZ41_03705 [Candidatus Babeliales bacterium]